MDQFANLGQAQLRVARPTDDLDAVVRFYREGMGFAILFEFHDHDGFDGVMLGHVGACYHLEFTSKRGHKVGRAPTEDNLLVFYLPNRDEWELAVARMLAQGHQPVRAFNPYWDRHGKTFEDPDGYRVVLQNTTWRALTAAAAEHVGDTANNEATWTVYRQGDDGNPFVVAEHVRHDEAQRLVAELEGRGHKQLYWVKSEDDD